MQARFQVKIRTNDSIRRYSFPEAPTWDAFKEHVNSQIIHSSNIESIILQLEYLDDENDTVTISSEEEWKEMLSQKHNKSLVTLFLRGWETVPKEEVVRTGKAVEDIEELSRREEEALQEIRRIMEQQENKRREEELLGLKPLEEELQKIKHSEDLKQEEDHKLHEQELLKREVTLKQVEEDRILQEDLHKKELLKQEEHRLLQEKLKRKEEKLKLKEDIKRRAEELKRKEEEIKRKVEELKREKKRRDDQKREEERIKEEKRQKAASLHQQNSVHIKKYQGQLAKLHELGFKDHKRNLHLLMTFNGNIDSVIDNLIAQ